jgi:hypothetical protein
MEARQMADTVRQVDYFYIALSDRPGEGAGALKALQEAGVHLHALHAFPAGRRAQVNFVPSDPVAFRTAAKTAKWKVTGPKKAFVIEGEDRTGALVGHLTKLGEAKINVTATTALVAGAGRFGAILWVKPRDVRRAAAVLGAG